MDQMISVYQEPWICFACGIVCGFLIALALGCCANRRFNRNETFPQQQAVASDEHQRFFGSESTTKLNLTSYDNDGIWGDGTSHAPLRLCLCGKSPHVFFLPVIRPVFGRLRVQVVYFLASFACILWYLWLAVFPPLWLEHFCGHVGLKARNVMIAVIIMASLYLVAFSIAIQVRGDKALQAMADSLDEQGKKLMRSVVPSLRNNILDRVELFFCIFGFYLAAKMTGIPNYEAFLKLIWLPLMLMSWISSKARQLVVLIANLCLQRVYQFMEEVFREKGGRRSCKKRGRGALGDLAETLSKLCNGRNRGKTDDTVDPGDRIESMHPLLPEGLEGLCLEDVKDHENKHGQDSDLAGQRYWLHAMDEHNRMNKLMDDIWGLSCPLIAVCLLTRFYAAALSFVLSLVLFNNALKLGQYHWPIGFLVIVVAMVCQAYVMMAPLAAVTSKCQSKRSNRSSIPTLTTQVIQRYTCIGKAPLELLIFQQHLDRTPAGAQIPFIGTISYTFIEQSALWASRTLPLVYGIAAGFLAVHHSVQNDIFTKHLMAQVAENLCPSQVTCTNFNLRP